MQTLIADKVEATARLARETHPLLGGAFEFIAIQAREIDDLRKRIVALERKG